MSTEIENKGLVEVKTETTVIDPSTGHSAVIQNGTAQTPPSEEWLETKAKASAVLDDPIGYSTKALKPYLPILKAIGWALLAVVSLKLVLTLLGAILSVATSIPILSPFFELVGVSYAGWFIYRNLLTASQRQEFSQKVAKIKKEVIGGIGEMIDTDKSEIS